MPGPNRPEEPDPPDQDPTELAGQVDGAPTELSATAWAADAHSDADSPATSRALAWSQEDPKAADAELAYSEAAAPPGPETAPAPDVSDTASAAVWYRRPVVLFWLSVLLVLTASIGLALTMPTTHDAPQPQPGTGPLPPQTSSAPQPPNGEPRHQPVDPPTMTVTVPGEPPAPHDETGESPTPSPTSEHSSEPPTATSTRPSSSSTTSAPTTTGKTTESTAESTRESPSQPASTPSSATSKPPTATDSAAAHDPPSSSGAKQSAGSVPELTAPPAESMSPDRQLPG